jgi:threonylcarbamoyladenosine tRNA methylthiotransferase MtaB
MASFSIRNFGCRVNQAEAFDWAAELQRGGLDFEPDPAKSEIVVLNTCTLTSRADRDVKKFIRHVARTNPAARIVVTGCLAERAPDEIAGLPGIWKIIPNSDKDSLPDGVRSAFFRGNTRPLPLARPEYGGNDPREARGPLRPRRGSREQWAFPERSFRKRAFLKVQDGCGMACAFCVIPSVRGRSRSLAPAEVLSRLAGLAGRGYREAVLSGIHLSSYGRDLSPRASLLELLREIDGAPEGIPIRLSSLDPRLTAEDLIDLAAASARIRPHFHLSLQHGSPSVLEAMGRPGSPEAYLRLLERFRARAPQAALGADVLVGFPGETDEDFQRTEEFLRASPLTYVHVFAYSPRPGTAAAARLGVPSKARAARADRLRRFSGERDLAFRRSQAGRTLRGIVIRNSAQGTAVLTENALDVRLARCESAEGAAVVVRVLGADEAGTAGEIIAEGDGR